MEQEVRPTKWTLQGLLPDSDKAGLEEAFSNLEAALVEFEATKELLAVQISEQEFKLILDKLEILTLQKSRLEAFAELSFAADTQDPAVLNLRDRVDQVLTGSANRTLFFEMWFKELSPETIQKLIDYSGDLHYFIELGFRIIEGQSAIVPVIIGEDMKTFVFWRQLFDAGVFVNAFVSPGVPPIMAMLRTSYMATHEDQHLNRILQVFAEIGGKLGVIQ